ncbi:MCE family protein [Mycobacteroides abscessus]|uniref:MCE family protein n=1 Tax=Mycobacteroides abscessus TaxID=36809 RepID=UPI0009260A6B|nr:MCE family protein [Mycobacteroides abscessus]MDO3333932.1 MCE family protein [Mycobacteroides abscessus subsp. bolletii]SIB90340.1 MCE-family protein Mce6D [Mycobacteroides abscessus subsp. bolletii]SKS87300.1 MCE-family protein Mce6D [Mycobacteroides abscessus subsp. bolletii]SKT10730.1 MCE-family protein Mce6D [Mycobacteroides abscessus subsp. bolletii]SLD07205.1 MCE-family protein Mce6D [Mycobacteroides abscessus subsp. bolletii]
MNRLRAGRTATPLLAVLALICAAAAVVAVGTFTGGHHGPVRVTAQFEDTVGLYAGNSVSVLGMQIGKVTSVVPKHDFVEVKMEIDPDVAIPADVQAVTVSTSILTDRHVELTPPYKSGPRLADGDVLSLPRTRTPVEFDRTLAMADKLSRALNGNGQGQGPLADLVGLGTQIASGSGKDVKAALDQLSQALRLSSDDGAATRENIQSIADSLSVLTESAATNDTEIREFGSQIRQLSQIVADQNLGSGDTGAQLNQILDQAATLLEKNRGRLKPTMSNMETLTRSVADNRRELSEILDVLPMLGTNVYSAIDQDAGSMRVHAMLDKLLLDSQMTKEICNLASIKDLGCNTGTIADAAPGFGAKFFVDGMTGMLQNMAGPTP